MGDIRRRSNSRQSHPPPPSQVTPQSEVAANRLVHPASTPYTSQYRNSNPSPYFQCPGYYPVALQAMPVPLLALIDHHPRMGSRPHMDPSWRGGPVIPPRALYVEHQKAVTIRTDIAVRKETLRMEPDDENPGHFLVAFVFDATVAGSISIIFFAKEYDNGILGPTKGYVLPHVTLSIGQGLGQKFRQPVGTGIDLSFFEESDLLKVADMDVYPLAVRLEASYDEQDGPNDCLTPESIVSRIIQAVFEEEEGEFRVKVVKEILWVNELRYELEEIYGIGDSVESNLDADDSGNRCVICLSKPRDTAVRPCRHMCMCSECAEKLMSQSHTSRCPICRQPVERLLAIEVSTGNGTKE